MATASGSNPPIGGIQTQGASRSSAANHGVISDPVASPEPDVAKTRVSELRKELAASDPDSNPSGFAGLFTRVQAAVYHFNQVNEAVQAKPWQKQLELLLKLKIRLIPLKGTFPLV